MSLLEKYDSSSPKKPTENNILKVFEVIHTSLSPNTEKDDLWLAFKSLLQPWKWKNGPSISMLEKAFAEEVGVDHAMAFQRGRDALLVLLESLGIGQGDEVILQAYTCIVVPNAVLYTGAKPVYADITPKGFNIDPEDIAKKVSKKTKAIIIQHTFGVAADIAAIKKICKEHGLLLIEDCAHALSGKWNGKPLGSFGDAAIWSFGRDKIISGVWGGMITTDSGVLAEKIQQRKRSLPSPSRFQILQSLLHPLVFAVIKPFYSLKLAKAVLVLVQKLQLIPRVIFSEEKQAKKPTYFPQQMAHANAILTNHQLQKLPRFHRQRKELAKLYTTELQDQKGIMIPKPHSKADPAWLRFTIRSSSAQELLKHAKSKAIYLGDWYTTVLAPAGCALESFGYKQGSCPEAEKAARETLNLPTHIQVTHEQALKVVGFLKNHKKSTE